MKILKLAILSLPLAFSPIASELHAESLAMPVSTQGEVSQQTPRNGQNKAKVESTFGQPLQRVAAVGEPPISKWVYSDFTVYFEHDIVLHAVRHRS